MQQQQQQQQRGRRQRKRRRRRRKRQRKRRRRQERGEERKGFPISNSYYELCKWEGERGFGFGSCVCVVSKI